MDTELIIQLIKDMQSGEFDRVIKSHEKLLNDDKYLYEFIWKLNKNRDCTCGKKNTFKLEKKIKSYKKSASFIYRCSNCSKRKSATTCTLVKGTKNRLTKYTNAIVSPNKNIREFQTNINIKVYKKTAYRILDLLKIQGLFPETNKRVTRTRKDMKEIRTSCKELLAILSEESGLYSERRSLEKLTLYTEAKILESQCEEFFKKVDK